MSETDPQFRQKFTEIVNSSMTLNWKRHAIGELFRQTVERLTDEGKTEAEIAELTGVDTIALREQVAKARETRMAMQTLSIKHFKDKGKSNAEIADLLGLSENAVRTILEP